MATLSDINNTVLSGLTHIDALLDDGPDWNYLTPGGNTIYYTFSVTSGNETGKTGQEVFTVSQQNWARHALVEEFGRITGINFVETTDGNAAHIHFCNIDIADPSTTGQCNWHTRYFYDAGHNLVSYNANAYIYMDNAEWYARNRDLTPGGQGYQTLLHELGHALGLKHPFKGDINLPSDQDNKGNTLMSYVHEGGPYQHLNQYDIAALNWIYGGDGLGGELGLNSRTGARYFTGTNAADTLTGTAFDDTLDGKGGLDVMVYSGARVNFDVRKDVNGYVVMDRGGSHGTDTLVDIERIKFDDDKWLALDIDGNAGQVYRLYQATFDRAPDSGGFSFWLNGTDKHGLTLNQMAELFMTGPEFIDMYMSDPSDQHFLTQLYAHVLHRQPDVGGMTFWLDSLKVSSRAEVLTHFSESPENQAQVIGSIEHGIEYIPYGGG